MLTLASMAPFCDHYQVLKESSIWLCGGTYCKKDQETANWIENGSALLEACDEDLQDNQNRLKDLYRELEDIQVRRDAWGILMENFTENAQGKDQEYAQLRETNGEIKNRRLLIVGGIKTARQKQQDTKQRVFDMCKQAQALKEAKMRRVEQYVEGQAMQPPPSISPQAAPRTDNLVPRRMLSRADSGLWEGGDLSGTPCRTTTNAISPTKPASNKPFQAQMDYSPPTLAPALSFTNQQATVERNPSPPKKRRGRPPKIKPDASAPGYSYQISPTSVNTTGKSTAEYESRKRRATKTAKANVSPAQKLPSSGTRRSGRVKQKISYAESPTSSPERPLPERFDAGMESAAVNEPGRPTRIGRVPSNKRYYEEEVYTPDEEDDRYDARNDGDWQGNDGMGEDDMDIDVPPAQQERWTTKRAATSPPRDPRLLKRQNTTAYQDVRHSDFDHYGEQSSEKSYRQYKSPGQGHGWSYLEKPIIQPNSRSASNRSNKQPLAASPKMSSHNTYISVSPQVNRNGRYNTPPYGSIRNGKTSTPHYQTSPLAQEMVFESMEVGGQQDNGRDLSPMRRSDMLNGLGGAEMLEPVDDFDDANYDFDVGAMSRQVAELDAQQN
ncbi:hypothetical protein D6D20_08739 [Aureobasidium pullulans]|uniref:Uncharacterized protein n=1 Tax=Aureobasidium pullulans TaxID=5580 RepID=A0A4S8YZN6_AURPU|nr:hypothetical protein D6D20_08739 [Aureobasidium pullulans]